MVRRLLAAVGIALVATVALLMILEERLLFPAHAVGPAGPLPQGAIEIEAASADRTRLVGVHVPPSSPTDLLVLVFPGNGWNSFDAATVVHSLYPDAHVVAFHYRGYRSSEGSPSAKALLDDAPLVHDAAVAASGARRVLLVGMSIGTGVATHLATERDVAGAILVTPFDSLRKVAAEAIPVLPIEGLFRNEIASAESLKGRSTPTAIVAAERDEIISTARTDGLRSVAANLLFDRTIEGAGHNDIYGRKEFVTAMSDARTAILSAQ